MKGWPNRHTRHRIGLAAALIAAVTACSAAPTSGQALPGPSEAPSRVGSARPRPRPAARQPPSPPPNTSWSSCWRTRTSTKCWAPERALPRPPRPNRGRLHQRARRNPPQSAQLPRPVLRQHTGDHRRLLPSAIRRAEPGHPATDRGPQLRRLLRKPACARLHRLPPRRVRPEALALGGVHQPPAGREPALERVACLLRPTAHGRLRHPQPLQRHARLRGQRW